MSKKIFTQNGFVLSGKTKLKQIITLSCLIVVLVLPFFVFAESAPLTKLKEVGTTKGPFVEADQYSFAVLVGTVVKAFLSLLGIIFIILVIYGGYKWMMARGSEQEVEAAKNIIQRAIIGLIIIVAAYAITAFVFTGLEDAVQ